MRRCAGLLLHPTSLPSRFGIGDLGPAAIRFLEWARAAGQSLWQVLPLGPTFAHGSPYDSPSAFAGNPWLISPELLMRDGLLRPSDLVGCGTRADRPVNFEVVARQREVLLRKAFTRFESPTRAQLRADADDFATAPEQAPWLEDWCLFAALEQTTGIPAWWRWSRGLARRHRRSLAKATATLAAECAYHRFVQFCFARQWTALRAAAHERGIAIVGDVPIYVARHSADTWTHRRLFEVDADGQPAAVAGVPPDDFSDEGQLWGNPLYRWPQMRRDDFTWWVDRIACQAARCDHLRLDHFRGFVGYWRVAGDATTARDGRWVAGPGRALFDTLERRLGSLSLIAEDLGVITEDVKVLRRQLAFPGTRVLQFGFGEATSEHAPHNLPTDVIVYSGTHDNDTTRGWFETLSTTVQKRVLNYTGGRRRTIAWDVIRVGYTSRAAAAIVPLQDVLGLATAARMNTPGTVQNNWRWRLQPGSLRLATAHRLRTLVALSGRCCDQGQQSRV